MPVICQLYVSKENETIWWLDSWNQVDQGSALGETICSLGAFGTNLTVLN